HTGARVRTNIEVLVFRELDRGRVFHRLLSCGLPVHEQLTRTTFAETRAGVLELEPNGVFSRLEFRPFPHGALEIEQVVEKDDVASTEAQVAFTQEQAVAAEPSALSDDHAFRTAFGDLDLCFDGVVLRHAVRGAGRRCAGQLPGVLENFPT